MRKLISLLTCILLITSTIVPVSALEPSSIVYSTNSTLENGLVVTHEIVDISATRSTDKTYQCKSTYSDDGTVIAVIAFIATYRYDGSTVSVISKTVTQTDTYEGWSFTQKSFTSSNGTVTLTGTLSKWLIFNNNISMSMTCDKNGNISYS